MAAGGIAYRKDIDGLRTIAVTSVVLFHAGVPWIPAGFVGVDIFFVISGFLITGLLAKEYQGSGRVDIAAFYARRVRRLIPALLTMVLATVALGAWLLPPTGELQSMSLSALAALFFSSNLFFYFQPSGYFAQAAETYPLLHTWTLAVEEQFYIVWPLLIPVMGWMATKVRRSTTTMLTWLYVGVLVVSFLLCQWAIEWRPMAAFYLTPFRAWEFAVGALLALHLHRIKCNPALGLGLSGAGLAALLVGFMAIDPAAAFPGPMAMLPVLGAAALIAGGAIAPHSAITRLLEAPPMVYVGKLSYGWYLWHWPLLAFAHYAADGVPSVGIRTAMVLLSLLISAISLRWLETPIRRGKPPIFKTTRGALATGAMLLLAGAGAAGAANFIASRQLAASPLYQSIAAAKSFETGQPSQCQNYQLPFTALAPATECTLGAVRAERGVVLWGDSHAARLVPAMTLWAQAHETKMLARIRGGCRPFGGPFATVGIAPTAANREDCGNFRAAMTAELAGLRAQGFDRLVIASRWPYARDDEAQPTLATTVAWQDALARTIATARQAGFAVSVVADNPRFARSVPECLTRHPASACSATRADTLARRASLEQVLSHITPPVHLIDFTDTLCPTATCPAIIDGQVLYSDAHHLSRAGGAMLAERAPGVFAGLER